MASFDPITVRSEEQDNSPGLHVKLAVDLGQSWAHTRTGFPTPSPGLQPLRHSCLAEGLALKVDTKS